MWRSFADTSQACGRNATLFVVAVIAPGAAAFASGVLMTGCAHLSVEQRYEPIARFLTPQLINKHLIFGYGPASVPVTRCEGGQLLVVFDDRCLVTIGRGGSFFTEADYQNAQKGLFAEFLGEAQFPKIGRRARIAGLEQAIAIFTTTDGRFDVRIEPRGTPQPVDVVGVATELSELYDKRRSVAL